MEFFYQWKRKNPSFQTDAVPAATTKLLEADAFPAASAKLLEADAVPACNPLSNTFKTTGAFL
jgi:hypothetical protein